MVSNYGGLMKKDGDLTINEMSEMSIKRFNFL